MEAERKLSVIVYKASLEFQQAIQQLPSSTICSSSFSSIYTLTITSHFSQITHQNSILNFSPKKNPKSLYSSSTMAFSKASIVPAMVVAVTALALIGSAHAADAPAPSPTSGAGSIVPAFGAACVSAVVAMLFGSALRI